MKFVEYDILPPSVWPQLQRIWNEVYPIVLAKESLENFQTDLSKCEDYWHVLALDEGENVIGWYFDFVREKDRWFGIIIDGSNHGKGVGRRLLEIAKTNRSRLCGWVFPNSEYIKADGMYYPSPIPFYLKLGFEILPEVELKTDTFTLIKIRWERS